MSDWIPVNERLPEKDGRYLTYIINPKDSRLQYMMICDYFIFINSHLWSPDDETASNHVVAWMPLPEPYKGDYDCMACAHDGDSNICLECENGSKYLKWRTVK